MTLTFDWQALEDRLFEQSKALIRQFAAEHPDVLCSFFAYDTNPAYGEFLPSFDSYENMLRMAQEDEQRAIISRREQMQRQEWSWRWAHYVLRSVSDSSPDVSAFAYHIYAEIRSAELEALSVSGTYPQNNDESEDDYINGNVRIVLWKVVERLIAAEAFAPLRLASPFRVGYQFHDDGHFIVLRLLNWPQV
jgi:hypothetical protein